MATASANRAMYVFCCASTCAKNAAAAAGVQSVVVVMLHVVWVSNLTN